MLYAFLASIALGTNAVTFTATATGIEKGTAVEFFWAAKDTDRDYETLFLLDDSPAEIARAIETSGIPVGKPIEIAENRLWPVGVPISISPKVDDFLSRKSGDGAPVFPGVIYTGGLRKNYLPVAETTMPRAVFALYDCSQSLFQYDGTFPQSTVYGLQTAAKKIEKGTRVTFTVSWDGKTHVSALLPNFTAQNTLKTIQDIEMAAEKGSIEVMPSFDGTLTLEQATAIARALQTIDSSHVRVNGRSGEFFYRAFLPLVKWQDRHQRLTQPFEFEIGATNTLTVIHEDWNVAGNDPTLTTETIPLGDAKRFPEITTCFVYAAANTSLERIRSVIKPIWGQIENWYFYPLPRP